MIRSLWLKAGLVAILGLVGCTRAPGTICRDATGRSVENPGYCKLYQPPLPSTKRATSEPAEQAMWARAR
jgi:hypothetical protein